MRGRDVAAALILIGLLLRPAGAAADSFAEALVHAALERTRHTVGCDGSYMAIAYPGGDVPDHIGVCTDLVIRAYRGVGIDLQRLVHEDMATHFGEYPSQRMLR